MKKLLVIIIILFIIFVSLLIYRNNEKASEINIGEIKEIETYLKKVYGWKEITNEALPVFNDINNADERWLWGTIRENIDDYEINYEKIEELSKELYGKNFNKKYPKEGTEFISFDEQTGKYNVQEITLDAIKDSFLINKIEKNKEEYMVEIVEYLVDYTEVESGKIKIKNLKDEIIYELTEEEATDGNIQKVVKENMDRFTKKQVKLNKDNNNIAIVSVNLIA